MMSTDPQLFLGKDVMVQVDRPLGSTHPKYENITYTVNYGYVPDTKSPDGEELDAYILGVDVPLETYSGQCIAFIERLDDNDPKLIVAPLDTMFTDDDIIQMTHFQEQYFKSRIVRS